MKSTLVDYLAKSCAYAQEHIDGWEISKAERESLLQCTSFQVACFLAQNTLYGFEGVEWEVVIKELSDKMKSEKAWKKIINAKIKRLGGLK